MEYSLRRDLSASAHLQEEKHGMTTHTVVQVSDTHLSATHAYFQDNWDAFVEEMEVLQPDLVIHTGDVTFNAPDAPEDLTFARLQLDRLPCPWLLIPGNHDVGEPGENPRLRQPINAERMRLWAECYGCDRFSYDLGAWRLLGLNSELMGSGLPEEAEQLGFLERALADAGDRPVGVFIHKPLYIDTPGETDTLAHCVLPVTRAALLDRFRAARLAFVANGHIHSYFHGTQGDVDFVWCPTTAFIIPNKKMPVAPTDRAGYLVWEFEDDKHSHRLVEPPMFANIDITNWTRQKGTSISLPPRPLRPAAA